MPYDLKAMNKLLAALCFVAIPSLAEIVGFQDVEYFDKNVETGKSKKYDGMLSLDRDNGVFVFTSENRVHVTVPSSRITGLTYNDKDDRRLSIDYRDARDKVWKIEFKLKGGNRENILGVFNAETNNKLVRVGKK